MSPKLERVLESLKSLKGDQSGGKLMPPVNRTPTPMASERHEVFWNIDGSPSMSEYLAPLFKGMQQFGQDVRRDAYLKSSVDITVWALDDHTPAKRLIEAVPAERFEAPLVPTCSHSPVYGAMTLTWQDAIHRQEKLSRAHDCDVASSWVFLFSDCGATDMEHSRACAMAMQMEAREAGVNTFVLTLGAVDERVACELSDPGRPPIALASVDDFAEFFVFLRRSLRQKSISMPGQPLRLEFRGKSLNANG